jgi:hypothetical protein
MKFIGNKISPEFLNNIDDGFSKSTIIKFICDIDNDLKINLKTPIDSIVMGDIQILFSINNDIYNYEKESLDDDLSKIQDYKIRKKIRMLIKQFIYFFLNHILKVISIISNEIKNDPSKKDMKNNLQKYSTGIMYRISSFVKDYIDVQMGTIDDLDRNVRKMIDIGNKLSNIVSSPSKTEISESKSKSEPNSELNNNSSSKNTTVTGGSSSKTYSSEKILKKIKEKPIKISSIDVSELFKGDNLENGYVSESNDKYYDKNSDESDSDDDDLKINSISE